MQKNGLTQRVGFLVRQGLAGSVDVEKYLRHATFFDPDFPERLKAGFVIKYNELQNAGMFGDELFEGLMLATVNGRFNLTHQAACLSILVYLFQKCEIFDK